MKCIVCEEDFSVKGKGSGGQNRKICFDCMPEGLSREERNTLRARLYNEKMKTQKKQLGCSICGYNKCASALEWHHTDSSIKDMAPSDSIKRSWESYEREAEKCILLCSNCHREIHDKNM